MIFSIWEEFFGKMTLVWTELLKFTKIIVPRINDTLKTDMMFKFRSTFEFTLKYRYTE